VGHLVKTVDTARYAGTKPQAYKAHNSSNDPGKGTRLRVGPGGDVLLTMRAHHGDRPVPEAGSGHVLYLGDHLYWGLHHRLGRILHGLGRGRPNRFFR